MSGLKPVPWKTLERVFLKAGFKFERQVGSHRTYSKEGVLRPIVIPAHSTEVTIGVIKNNLKTACLSREEYLKLLDE